MSFFSIQTSKKIDPYLFYKGVKEHQHPKSWVNGLPDPSPEVFELLEYIHDFIQYWFPSMQASKFSTVKLEQYQVDAFRADNDEAKEIRQLMLKRFELMLCFYGLTINRDDANGIKRLITDEKGISIFKASDYDDRKQWLWINGGHNLLRISRIFSCFTTLGLWPEALALYKCVSEIAIEELHNKNNPLRDRLQGALPFWKANLIGRYENDHDNFCRATKEELADIIVNMGIIEKNLEEKRKSMLSVEVSVDINRATPSIEMKKM